MTKKTASSYKCSKCGAKTVHIELWDAYACLKCNRWNEPVCSDHACGFCSKRPATPMAEA